MRQAGPGAEGAWGRGGRGSTGKQEGSAATAPGTPRRQQRARRTRICARAPAAALPAPRPSAGRGPPSAAKPGPASPPGTHHPIVPLAHGARPGAQPHAEPDQAPGAAELGPPPPPLPPTSHVRRPTAPKERRGADRRPRRPAQRPLPPRRAPARPAPSVSVHAGPTGALASGDALEFSFPGLHCLTARLQGTEWRLRPMWSPWSPSGPQGWLRHCLRSWIPARASQASFHSEFGATALCCVLMRGGWELQLRPVPGDHAGHAPSGMSCCGAIGTDAG